MSLPAEPIEIHEPTPWRRRDLRWALLVCAFALLPLLPTLRAAFVYDDGSIIRDNALLRGWGSLLRVWSAEYWPIGGSGLYRPVHLALLSLVWNAGGGQAVWFHGYAMLVAALTSIAVWWLARQATAAGAAAGAAIWFAAHPLHVEATASVANSSELLVVLCTVGLVAVLRSSRDGTRARDAVVVAALTGVALLCKESGVMALPLAAMTAWGWRGGRTEETPAPEYWRAFVSDRRALWIAGGVAVAVVLVARRVVLGGGGAHVGVVAPGLVGLSVIRRSAIMLSLWPHVVAMVAWPSALSPYYGPSLIPPAAGAFALMALAIAAVILGVAVMFARRGDERLLVAVAWVVLTWLPASNLMAPTGPLLSDRTLFGVTVGTALALAWVVDRLRGRARAIAISVFVVVAMRNAVESATYARDWTSHRLLWTRLVRSVPAEHLGYKLLGMDARARGDTTESLRLLQRARSLAPADESTLFELGQTLYAHGQFEEAARVIAPLMSDGDALARPELVAMYLDAVGRARGAPAVVQAATPLMSTRAADVAGAYRRAALVRVAGAGR